MGSTNPRSEFASPYICADPGKRLQNTGWAELDLDFLDYHDGLPVLPIGYALFSHSGFTPALEARAEGKGVLLVGLESLLAPVK